MTKIRDLTTTEQAQDPAEEFINNYYLNKSPTSIPIREAMRDAIQWAREQQSKPKKPIEFVKVLGNPDHYELSGTSGDGAKHWKNVDRILKNWKGYDVMHAWDDDETKGVLYIGHWNDGVV